MTILIILTIINAICTTYNIWLEIKHNEITNKKLKYKNDVERIQNKLDEMIKETPVHVYFRDPDCKTYNDFHVHKVYEYSGNVCNKSIMIDLIDRKF
jgi:hypothetical protein